MNITVVIPQSVYMGYIIGFGGRTIRNIEEKTKTKIRWPYKSNPAGRKFTIYGFGSLAVTNVDKAVDEILQLVNGRLAAMDLPLLEKNQLVFSLARDNAPERQVAVVAQQKKIAHVATLPSEVLEIMLLFHTREVLDKLTRVSSRFANVILTDAFAAKSPLRTVISIVLNSLQEVVLKLPKTPGGIRDLSLPLTADAVSWVRLCFFQAITLNGRVPALLQWFCTHRMALHSQELTVSTPLASFELLNVRCFKHTKFISDKVSEHHLGPRRRLSLQCDFLRDCEQLSVECSLSGWVNALPDIVSDNHINLDMQDVVQWLHRSTDTAKGRRLILQVNHIDGDVVRLVEMLEEPSLHKAQMHIFPL